MNMTAEYPPFVRASVQQKKAKLYYRNKAKLYRVYIYSLAGIAWIPPPVVLSVCPSARVALSHNRAFATTEDFPLVRS